MSLAKRGALPQGKASFFARPGTAQPCAVRSDRRMILPAFGALTGGLDARDPAIRAALQPASLIEAVLPAGGRLVQFPLWRGGPDGPASPAPRRAHG